jgi:hypothetical protein
MSSDDPGNADLGDSWRPPAGPGRDLHEWIIELRMTVYAHADWTANKTIVDTNAMLGDTGPPMLAESRSSLSNKNWSQSPNSRKRNNSGSTRSRDG